MTKRAYGIGTLSLPLALIGVAWGFTLYGVCMGDSILGAIGLRAWSHGNSGIHLTVFYSLIFLIPAFMLGKKYSENFGAKTGKTVSGAIAVFLILSAMFLVR